MTRHIEARAAQYRAAGHEVRVLSPVDPDDRLTLRLHRGARPSQRPLPEYLVPLGRTVGFPSNGAVSNVAYGVSTVVGLRRELEQWLLSAGRAGLDEESIRALISDTLRDALARRVA